MIYSKDQTTVEGLDELIKAFQKLPEDALQYAREGANEAAQKVCNRAKQLSPVDTGATQRLLYVKKASKTKKVKYKVLATIGAKKGAAALAPLELGHKLFYFGKETSKHIEAKPFLRPAADESHDEVISSIAESMNKALDKMGGIK